MIRAFKDSSKINLVLTILFLAGIGISAYVLYRLPNNLMIPYGYESIFNTTYLVVSLTFLVGALAVTQALRYKKELVVYRDKKNETGLSSEDAAGEKSSINVESLKNALKTTTGDSDVLKNGLQSICKQLEAGQGAAYTVQQENDLRFVELKAGYALSISETSTTRYNFGEGLIGQAASSGQLLYLDEVPEGYVKIVSGLGSASPRYILIVPMKHQNSVRGVLEIASFSPFSQDQRKFVEQGAQLVAEKLSTQ